MRESISKVFDLFIDLVPKDWLATIERLKQEVLSEALGKISDFLDEPGEEKQLHLSL